MTSEKTKEIKQQLEFYFGDVNLPSDSFLLALIESNSDGCTISFPIYSTIHFNLLGVSLYTILSFNKMRKYTIEDMLETFEVASPEGLELDRDSMRVKRLAPIIRLEGEDEIRRTVYLVCYLLLILIY